MEDLLGRITVNGAQLDGKPCIRGMRITVQTVLEFLNAGNTAEEILEQYPALDQKDIQACLHYAARISGKEISYVMV